MEKIDFSQDHKDEYSAGKRIKEVDVDTGVYLAVPGQGAPGGKAFQGAVGQLYGVAYALKFTHKTQKDFDFKVSKLECLWDIDDPSEVPVDEWRWRLLIRIPESIGAAELEETKTELRREKGRDASKVERLALREGRCLQVMHVGPYEKESETYALLFEHAAAAGLVQNGRVHEIYISDPQRSAPEKLKTILRLPVR